MLLNHLLLLVASIGLFGLVAGQNEVPTVPCYGPDCLVPEPTTEMGNELNYTILCKSLILFGAIELNKYSSSLSN